MNAVRNQLLIALCCVALIVYIVLLGRIAVGLIADQISQLRLIQLATLDSMPHRPVRLDTVVTVGSARPSQPAQESTDRHEPAHRR